jgi:hypothetical protein
LIVVVFQKSRVSPVLQVGGGRFSLIDRREVRWGAVIDGFSGKRGGRGMTFAQGSALRVADPASVSQGFVAPAG